MLKRIGKLCEYTLTLSNLSHFRFDFDKNGLLLSETDYSVPVVAVAPLVAVGAAPLAAAEAGSAAEPARGLAEVAVEVGLAGTVVLVEAGAGGQK
jgi:hypothetical protein